jgi:hypothetical protein
MVGLMFENFKIEFILDYTGQLETLNVIDGNLSEEFYLSLIKLMVESGTIVLSEKTKGTIEYIDGITSLNYRV